MLSFQTNFFCIDPCVENKIKTRAEKQIDILETSVTKEYVYLISKSSKDEEIRTAADLEPIREWLAYNDYVRKKYLKVLESLTTEQLSKDRGASFPSLVDISAHVYFAYRLWP